jgi:pimeloyl-ACP methyl ester carboxylesterase
MPYISREGVRVYYEEAGAGPPLLLSHGFACSGRLWHAQLKGLSDSCRLIAWDARGHDRSDSPGDPAQYSRAASVADMEAILDACGIDRAVLVGHSMGSLISVNFALQHPDRTTGLILVGGGAGVNSSTPQSRKRWNAMVERIAGEIETYGLHPPAPKAGEFSAGSILNAPEAQLARHRSADGLAKAARGTFTFEDNSALEALPTIDARALVVAGEHEELFMESAERLAEALPNGRLEIVAGAAHSPNLERPDEFNRLVRRFLADAAVRGQS